MKTYGVGNAANICIKCLSDVRLCNIRLDLVTHGFSSVECVNLLTHDVLFSVSQKGSRKSLKLLLLLKIYVDKSLAYLIFSKV
jgi:hypothetical protein